eukprot:6204267-Pleurochrysis_carterae.AAC.2
MHSKIRVGLKAFRAVKPRDSNSKLSIDTDTGRIENVEHDLAQAGDSQVTQVRPFSKSSEVESIFEYFMQSALMTPHKVVQSRILRRYPYWWHRILRQRLKAYEVVPTLWRVPKSLTNCL